MLHELFLYFFLLFFSLVNFGFTCSELCRLLCYRCCLGKHNLASLLLSVSSVLHLVTTRKYKRNKEIQCLQTLPHMKATVDCRLDVELFKFCTLPIVDNDMPTSSRVFLTWLHVVKLCFLENFFSSNTLFF